MNIYIIRHGETDGNVEGKLQGWYDVPLNSMGVFLAEETGKKLSDIRFDVAYSSPLMRAVETADLVLKNSGNENVPLYTDDRIKEICFGEWEGKRFKSEPRELPKEEVDLIFTDPFAFDKSPGGESFVSLCKRTQDFLKELAAKKEYRDSNILVATHGCALRAMLNFLYDNPRDFWHGQVPYNCVVNIVEARNGNCRLVKEDVVYYDKKWLIDRYKTE